MSSLRIFILLLALVPTAPDALGQALTESSLARIVMSQNDDGFWVFNPAIHTSENPRLVAIGLDIALGLFGVHRLYLGTDIKVPIAYTLTFGGGGVLWLVDLALLVASPSIESFKNNPHFFMWIPPSNQSK